MKIIEHTGTRRAGLILFGLVSLSASGLAGAHGAPDSEGAPEGIVKARITHQPDIPGLNAIILDAPRPGIMLRYQGEDTLTVLGKNQEDFLRFSGKEVMANLQSPSWQALPNSQPEPAQPSWAKQSQSGSYGWLDPRLDVSGDTLQGSKPREWSIGIRTTSGDVVRIAGTLSFQPINQAR